MPLVLSGCLWCRFGASGVIWVPLVSSGCLWRHLSASGVIRVPLLSSGCLWCRLGASGVVWVPLVSSEGLWCHLSASGVFWVPLGSSGCLWCRLGASGVVWVPLASSGCLIFFCSVFCISHFVWEPLVPPKWVGVLIAPAQLGSGVGSSVYRPGRVINQRADQWRRRRPARLSPPVDTLSGTALITAPGTESGDERLLETGLAGERAESAMSQV